MKFWQEVLMNLGKNNIEFIVKSGYSKPVNSIAFSPNGKILAPGGVGASISLTILPKMLAFFIRMHYY
jgi:WD40 repeat protein